MKLNKSHASSVRHSHFFAHRVKNVWNSLPNSIVVSSTVTVSMFYTTSFRLSLAVPSRTGHLTDKNFMQRMLYLNSYQALDVLTRLYYSCSLCYALISVLALRFVCLFTKRILYSLNLCHDVALLLFFFFFFLWLLLVKGYLCLGALLGLCSQLVFTDSTLFSCVPPDCT